LVSVDKTQVFRSCCSAVKKHSRKNLCRFCQL